MRSPRAAGFCERRWQFGRNYAGDQEGKAKVAETVQDEERAQGVAGFHPAERRPDIQRSDNPPSHQPEGHTDSERDLRRHWRLLPTIGFAYDRYLHIQV